MTVHSLTELNIHDSELLGINIDRIDRNADRVTLRIRYVEDYHSGRRTDKSLFFSGCLKIIVDLNFNVATPDWLDTGYEVEPSELLQAVRDTWKKAGVDLGHGVKHFRIETNTTAGVLDIVAKAVEIVQEWVSAHVLRSDLSA